MVGCAEMSTSSHTEGTLLTLLRPWWAEWAGAKPRAQPSLCGAAQTFLVSLSQPGFHCWEIALKLPLGLGQVPSVKGP